MPGPIRLCKSVHYVGNSGSAGQQGFASSLSKLLCFCHSVLANITRMRLCEVFNDDAGLYFRLSSEMMTYQ